MNYPRQIVLETTRRCNLRCIGCYREQQSDFAVGDMDFDLFRNIVDQIDFPCTVPLFMDGDPLCNPQFPSMFDMITQRDNIRSVFCTNGMTWSDEVFNLALTRKTCYEILFSIDGWLPDTAEGIRPGSHLMDVENNMLRLLNMRDLMKADHLLLGVKLVQKGQDFGEVMDYVRGWLLRGVDFVVVGRYLDYNFRTPAPRHFRCRYLDDYMVVRYNGDVILCERAGDNAPVLGNLRENTLKSQFMAESIQGIRKAYPTQEPCSHCSCSFTGDGVQGTVSFRGDPESPTIYYHEDYYNRFFSRTPVFTGFTWGNEWRDRP